MADTKTILYIHKGRFPEEVRAEKLCKSLAKAGHTVILVCKWYKENKQTEEIDGYTVYRVGFSKISFLYEGIPGNPFWTKAISNCIYEFSPDLIICREILLMSNCVNASKGKNIPLLIDMAEHYPAAMKEWKKYKSNIIGRIFVHILSIPQLIEKHAVKHAHGIITVCVEQNNRLIKEYHYPPHLLSIVHNTPYIDAFSSCKKGSRIPPIVFAHHGYFTLERNLELLVEGFNIAAQQIKNIQLVLAGEGETKRDIIKKVNSLSCKDRIHILDAYKAKDLCSLYSETDIGILPYTIDDFRNHTLPNKAFDYISCGKPIISSSLHPMKRLLDETQAGIYGDCSTPKGISELINTMYHANIEEMSNNGLNSFKETYNWQIDEKELLRFINTFNIYENK
ncbi:hypothetical protein LBMAG36_09180 [Chlorobiota bacterium]|nr:hypothetical protein LBMAG36_09180 [Chlorobiota bacterium]